jgi:hypothetical protein
MGSQRKVKWWKGLTQVKTLVVIVLLFSTVF